jgi:hypothetical protein
VSQGVMQALWLWCAWPCGLLCVRVYDLTLMHTFLA